MKFGYTIYYVPDVEATLAFYTKAFGFKRKFLHESGTYGELDTGATTLGFAAETMRELNGVETLDNRASAKPAGVEIAFVTDDVAKAYEKAVAAGAEGLKKPAAKPWGQIVAYVRDLNGCLVEICTPVGG
jgi:catechol 2,3-dioxygenase-like lactoylglutathione lyase family enzyme